MRHGLVKQNANILWSTTLDLLKFEYKTVKAAIEKSKRSYEEDITFFGNILEKSILYKFFFDRNNNSDQRIHFNGNPLQTGSENNESVSGKDYHIMDRRNVGSNKSNYIEYHSINNVLYNG